MELEPPAELPEPRAAAKGPPRNGFCRDPPTEHDSSTTADVEQMSSSSPVLPVNSMGMASAVPKDQRHFLGYKPLDGNEFLSDSGKSKTVLLKIQG